MSASPQPVRVFDDSLVGSVLNGALAALLGVLVLVWVILKRPPLVAAVVVVGGLCWLLGVHDGTAVALFALMGVVAWRFVHRRSFERVVGCWLRPLWVRYRYQRHWHHTTRLCGLHKAIPAFPDFHPWITRVQPGAWMDVVYVRMLKGQTRGLYAEKAEQLADALNARECRVRQEQPGRVMLQLMHGDPLEHVVPALAFPHIDAVDLDAVVVGVTETGEAWTVKVAERHLLVGGATRSGKSQFLWALLAGMAPVIRSGLVELRVLDPKGGMELGPGRPLYSAFECRDFKAMGGMLRETVVLMEARQARFDRLGVRKHVPSWREPLVLVVIDEFGKLALIGDRALKKQIDDDMRLLLMQGAGVGIVVLGATQEPSKQTLPYRDLFNARLAFRLEERTQNEMLFGENTEIRADGILKAHPGRAIVRLEGDPDPTHVRTAFYDDAAIAELVGEYAIDRRLPVGAKGSAILRGEVVDMDTDEATAAEIAAIRARLGGPAANGRQPAGKDS